MRYRHFSYRYTFIVQSKPPHHEHWEGGKCQCMMAQPYWSPAADVYETDDEFIIFLELASIDPDQLEILLYEDALVVHGKRNLRPSPSQQGMYHLAEISQGPFCFELPLAESFAPEQIETKYENGLLSISLKKGW